MKLSMRLEIVQKARNDAVLTDAEKVVIDHIITTANGNACRFELNSVPEPFLRALLDDKRLSINQRAQLTLKLHGMSGAIADANTVWNTTVKTPVEFGSTFATLGSKEFNAEYALNGRWYPIILKVQFVENDRGGVTEKSVQLTAALRIADFIHHCYTVVSKYFFMDDSLNTRERTVESIMQELGFRRVQIEAREVNLNLTKTEHAAAEKGKLWAMNGSVLVHVQQHWWSNLESRPLGSSDDPRKVIGEPELETQQNRDSMRYANDRETNDTKLPFVRVFSLDLKRYVYADVRDLSEYEFDEEAMGKLVLPDNTMKVIIRIFNADPHSLTQDVVRGKHGGLVILAEGGTGTGKTLTAELYSEHIKRPLYTLEMGELGVTVQDVETNLQKVFQRVIRWGAILLFDEVDVFLTERDDNLNRSAIVGIFLRLLDYYKGIMFLTTNRTDVLDKALRSRIVLRLKYPELDEKAKTEVWNIHLQRAGLTVAGNLGPAVIKSNNGRQIRNLVRLAKVMYPEGNLTTDQLGEVCEYGCQ